MTPQIEPVSITYQGAKEIFGPSVKTFQRLVKAGKIKAKRNGARVLIDYASVKAHFAALPDVEPIAENA